MRHLRWLPIGVLSLTVGAAHGAHLVAEPGRGPTPQARGADVPAGGLHPIVNERGRVTLSVDGTGSLDPSGSTVTIVKPDGATVRAAWFFAATTGFSNHQLAGPILLDGVEVAWTGSTPSAIASYNYYGNVTDLVREKLDAAPAGVTTFRVVEPDTEQLDGEILAVIFDDPGQGSDRTVTLLFGAQRTDGDTFRVNLAQPVNVTDPDFHMELSLGISYGCQPPRCETDQFSVVTVNDTLLTSAAGGQDDGVGENGALLTVGGVGDGSANPVDPTAPPSSTDYDDERYDLRPFMRDGDRSLTFTTVNPSNDDNIFFAALTMNPPVTSVTPIDDAFAAAIAFRWAPVHYQDTAESYDRSDRYGAHRADFLAAIDFDGNWVSDDNADNLANRDNALRATVYYSVVETEVYWYVVYAFFHPWDPKSPHENDLEGLLMAIRKDGSRFGQLEAMITVAHDDFKQYTVDGSVLEAGDERIDGSISMEPGMDRPRTFQEAKGHGVYGYDPSKSDRRAFPGGDGIRYVPSESECGEAASGDEAEVPYCLVSLFAPNGVWAHRTDPSTFVDATGVFQGVYPGTMRGNDGNDDRAHMPWAWDDSNDGIDGDPVRDLQGGELAFDPARIFSVRIANTGETLRYVRNPYLGTEPQRRFAVAVVNACAGCSRPPDPEVVGSDLRRLLAGELPGVTVVPDFVVINEICSARIDQLLASNEATPYVGFHASLPPPDREPLPFYPDPCGTSTTNFFGNALLLRQGDLGDVTAKEYEVLLLQGTPGEPQYRQRSVACTTLAAGIDAHVCGTHLENLSGAVREDQLFELRDTQLRPNVCRSALLAGDFSIDGGDLTRKNQGDKRLPHTWHNVWDTPNLSTHQPITVGEGRGVSYKKLHVLTSATWRAERPPLVIRVPWSDHPILLVEYVQAAPLEDFCPE